MLGAIDRACSDKNWATVGMMVFDGSDDSSLLSEMANKDQVLLIDTNHRAISGYDDDLEVIDFMKFLSFGISSTGHSGYFLEEFEEVLVGDGGDSNGFLLDGDTFFSLDRLVEAFCKALARRETSGVFIDENDFLVDDEVLAIAMIEVLSPQCRNHEMLEFRVLRVVERFIRCDEILLLEKLFDMGMAAIGQKNLGESVIDRKVPTLRIERVSRERKMLDNLMELGIEAEVLRFDGRGNERKSGLINQNGVNFIDKGKIEGREKKFFLSHSGAVFEIIEPEAMVGDVNDIATIGEFFFAPGGVTKDDPDGQAHCFIEWFHPGAIAVSKIVIDRDNEDFLALERLVDGRCRGSKCFPFSGCHFCDMPVSESEPSEKLRVIVSLT